MTDHEWTNDPVCPYCGETYEGWEWEDYGGEFECDCGKIFYWRRYTVIKYSTEKIPVEK